MRIGIAYNLKSDFPLDSHFPIPEDAAEEFDLPETIEAVRAVLAGEGHPVFLLGGTLDLIEKIREWRIEFVFNIAEGFLGRSREAHIPSVLEMMGVPYSGSDPLGLAVTLDKSVMKQMALSLGVSTPEYWVLEGGQDAKKIPNRFPLFVKPLWQGSSKGIRRSSRVANREELDKELERLFKNYPGEPVLVEEYIPGREFTVGVLGNRDPQVLGVMEIAFRGPGQGDFFYSLEVKRHWKEEVEYFFPARLGSSQEESICQSALRLFQALRLHDVARFDFRMDPAGRFYFLEVNPLPGLSPESGDLVMMAQKKGWSYSELVLKIAHSAFSRYPELNQKSQRTRFEVWR